MTSVGITSYLKVVMYCLEIPFPIYGYIVPFPVGIFYQKEME